jgi:teichuronic acid exporter
MDDMPDMEMSKESPAVGPDLETAAGFRRRVVRGGTLIFLSRLLTQVYVWGSTLLIARFLTPLDYSIMSIGLLVVGLADLFAEAGIGRALIQKESLEPRDIDEGFTLNCLLSLAMYALLFVLADPLARHVFDEPRLPLFLWVLGIHVLLAPFMAIPLALLDRNLKMGKQSVIHVGTAVFQSSVVLALAIAGMGYWALVAGSLSRRVLEVAAYMWGSGWRPRLAPFSYRVKGLLRFGIHVSLSMFLWYWYSNVDYAFVSKFAGPIELGYYALAFQLSSLPAEKLTANIGKFTYPAFCRLQNDLPRLHDWFLRLLVLVGFLGMPVMVGMALVAEDGIAVVLGEKWLPAVVPFQLLSLAGLFKIFSSLFPVMYNVLGRPDLNFKLSLMSAIVFPVCYLAAGATLGMIGVCLVWMFVYPLVVLIPIHYTRHLTTVGVGDLLWSQRAALGATLFMAASVLAVQWCTPELPRLSRLGLSILVGVAAYVVPMLIFARQTVLADLGKLWRELRGERRGVSPP